MARWITVNLDSPKWIRPAATSVVWGSSSHLKVPQVQLMRPEIHSCTVGGSSSTVGGLSSPMFFRKMWFIDC